MIYLPPARFDIWLRRFADTAMPMMFRVTIFNKMRAMARSAKNYFRATGRRFLQLSVALRTADGLVFDDMHRE